MNDFDVANYLDSSEVIAEYLSQILEDGDIDELLSAIDDIARAKGMKTFKNIPPNEINKN